MTSRDYEPALLKFGIGGFARERHEVIWLGRVLLYQGFNGLHEWTTDYVLRRPGPERWLRFWQAVDDLGVWNWRIERRLSLLSDGTQWSLELERSGRHVSVSGSNTYPGHDQGSSHGPKSGLFDPFVQSLRELTDVKRIQ